MKIYSIGHSTRSAAEFLALLIQERIGLLADIRSLPSSKRLPHFGREALSAELAPNGIAYEWLGDALGGYRRQNDPDSPHTALRSPGFRNYADHMASAEFSRGIDRLIQLASQADTAFMCAERLWWNCHRSFVADYLTACRGVEVLHILERGKTEPHRLHRTARVSGGRLVYDRPEQAKLF